MSQTRSIVAGGTAAVLLLGVGTSILFAEPPRASGDIGGPVVVAAAPVPEMPAAATSAPPAEAVEPSTGPAPSTHQGALPARPRTRPAVTGTPPDAPGPPRAPTAAPSTPSTDLPSTGPWRADRQASAGASSAERPTSERSRDDTVRDENRSTIVVGRSGAREPWHGWIPGPWRSDACGTHR